MMTVEEAITGRHSVRAFLPDPVPREVIERILLSAGRAPSGTNAQPWKVWVLGIGRSDKDKMHAQHRRNFLFFDAPVGLIFSIDRDLQLGSWLDYGMFLQSIMIAARQFGLESCPQAAFLIFHDVLQRRLRIPASQMVVCGMSLGYPDKSEAVNAFTPERMPLSEYVTFIDSMPEP